MNQSSGCLAFSVAGALFAVMHWKYQIVNSLFPTKSIKQLTASHSPLHININMLREENVNKFKWNKNAALALMCGRLSRTQATKNFIFSVGQNSWERFCPFPTKLFSEPDLFMSMKRCNHTSSDGGKWLESNERVWRWKVVFNGGLEARVTLMKHDKRRKSISNQWRVYLQWTTVRVSTINISPSRLSATLNQTRVTWLPHLQRNPDLLHNWRWDGSQTFPVEQILWKSLRKLGGVSPGPAIREGVCLNNIILPPRVFLAY